MTDTTLSAGVSSGGITISTGDEWLISGSAVDFTVLSGGSAVVFAGGTASGTVVHSSGSFTVSSGGIVSLTTVGSDGSATVSSGGIATYTTLSGGFITVSNGGTTVSSLLTIDVQGPDVLVQAASELVQAGGIASDTTVLYFGGQDVNGGSAVSTTVGVLGTETAVFGGATYSTTVSSGGAQDVDPGGTTTSTTIIDGGRELVFGGPFGGGVASDTAISSGGALFVYSGGSAIGTTISTGGYLVVLPGGVQTDPHLSGGEIVSTGILFSSLAGVTLGGSATSGVTLSSTVTDVPISGTDDFLVVSSGMSELVLPGGSAVSTTLHGEASLEVFSGGTATSTTASGGSEDIFFGGVASITRLSGGIENIFSGGVASDTSIDAGGIDYVFSSGSAISTTISNGGTDDVYYGGEASFATVSDGGAEYVLFGGTTTSTTIVGGGYQYVSGGTTSNTTVGNGGTEAVFSAGTASGTTVEDGGTEVLSSGGLAIDTTVDLGGAIDVTFLPYVGGGGTASVGPGDVLSVTEGTSTYTQQLVGNYENTIFAPSMDSGSGTLLTLESTICFLAGTLIATPSGERAVEHLAVGDTVITLPGEARPIVWIGQGHAWPAPGQRGEATPLIVGKGALAANVPHRDLHVTKGHSLFLDDVLIPIECLVNDRTIRWDDETREVSVFHIELETHDVLLANGAPAESYRDDGNRRLFGNANTGSDQLRKPPVAPVLSNGPIVEAVWRRLRERSGLLPRLALTDDPDLHLLVDGRRIDAASRDGDVWLFGLHATPGGARIVSRAGSPQELGVASDARRLGVSLRRIEVRQDAVVRVIDASDPLLTQGFYPFEAANGLRWTGGNAVVPAWVFSGFAGPIVVALHCGSGTRYLDEDASRSIDSSVTVG
jgi:autotransporter passenger strand-loop-strand repeat protein